MTVRVIDIETTGTDPTVDAIIEIASVDLLKDGTIANQRTALVRPPLPVPPEASAVHHLIDADLAFAPELDEVLDQFKGADAYVAHNANFERSFLERLLGDALWACTYKCALRIWPDLLSHSNQALRYRLGLVNPFNIDRHTLSPHRALSDAIVTAAVFNEIAKPATWPEIVRWSSEPSPAMEPTYQARQGANHHAACAPRRASPDRTLPKLQHCPSARFKNPVPSAIVDLGRLVCPGRHTPEIKCSHQPKQPTLSALTTATRGCRSGSLRVCRRRPSLRPASSA
jgi:exodeoxyribonuclease X